MVLNEEEVCAEAAALNLKLGGQVYPVNEDEAERWEGKSGKKIKVAGATSNRAKCQVDDCQTDLISGLPPPSWPSIPNTIVAHHKPNLIATEIVKNIKLASLLVQIYADGEVEMKKVQAAKDCPNVVKEKQRSSSLEGVILVEEIRENADPVDSDVEEEDGTKAFGVMIQGKIRGRYHCCTHFCLMAEEWGIFAPIFA